MYKLIFLILFSLFNSNFQINGSNIIGSTINYFVKSFSGLDITFGRLEMNGIKGAKLFDVKIKGKNKKEILAEIKEAEVSLEVFARQKLKSILLKDIKAYIKLRKENKNTKMNWAEMLEGEEPFEVPNIGEITIKNGKVFYEDSSNKEKISKDVNISNGLIIFNKEEQLINIRAEGFDEDEKYKADVLISKEGPLLHLMFENLRLKDEYFQYTRASDFLGALDGKTNIDLTLNLAKNDFKGNIFLNGTLHSKEVIGKIENFKGNLQFKGRIIEGKSEGTINDINISSNLNVNLDKENILIEFSFPKISSSLLIDSLRTLKNLNINSEGNILPSKVFIELNNFSKPKINIRGKTKSENCKIFRNKLKDMTFSFDFVSEQMLNTPINIREFNINFENLNLDVKGSFLPNKLYNLNLKAHSDLSFLSAFYNFATLKGNVDLEGVLEYEDNKMKRCDFNFNFSNLENHFNFSNLKGKTNYNNLESNILLNLDKDKHFDFQVKYFLNDQSLKAYFNTHDIFEFKSDFLTFSVLGNSLLNLDENLDIKNSEINLIFSKIIMNYKNINAIFNKISLNGSINNNVFDFKPNHVVLNLRNNDKYMGLIELIDFNIKGLIDIKNSEYKINGYSSDFLFDIKNLFKSRSQKFSFSSIYSANKIYFEKFSSNKFDIRGEWDFKFEEKCSLNFSFNDLLLPYSFKIAKMKGDLKSINSSLELNFNANANYKNIKFPLEGLVNFKDNVLNLTNIIIGNNDLKGSVNFNNSFVEISFRAIDTGTLKFSNSAFNFLGNLYIYGTLEELKGYSNFSVKNVRYRDYNLPNLDGSFTYKNGQICFGDFLVYNDKNSFFLKPLGFLDFKKNIVNLNIFNENVNLEGFAYKLEGLLDLNISMEGSLSNPLYKVLINSSSVNYSSLKIDETIINLKGNYNGLHISNSYLRINEDKLFIKGEMDFDRADYNFNFKSDNINIDIIELLIDVEESGGNVSLDLTLTSQGPEGYVKVKDGIFRINSSYFFEDINIPLYLIKTDMNLFLMKNEIKIESFNSKFNEGNLDISGFILLKNTLLDKYLLNLSFRDNIFELNKDLQFKGGGELQILDQKVNGRIVIDSGQMIDIPKMQFSRRETNNKDFEVDLKIIINSGFEVSLGNLLNLEKFESSISGEVDVKYKENLSLSGSISAERGFLEFSNNNFKLSFGRLFFEPSRIAPYLQLASNANILDENIYLYLDGYLDSEEVKVEGDSITFSSQKSEKGDKIFKVYLWSESGLSLDEITYLLSSSDASTSSSNKFQSGKFLSQQVGKSLVLNPISKKIRNVLGIYQFKLNTQILNLESLMKKETLINPFVGAEVEVISNLYKTDLFGSFAIKLADLNSEYIEYLKVGVFTRNRWMVNFAIKGIFQGSYLSDFGISKRFNIGSQSFLIGFSGIEDFIINPNFLGKSSNLKLEIEANLRF